MVKEQIVPIIVGVSLSGLGTLMTFAYDSIHKLENELVNHRVLLSKLVTPEGIIIQSPTSAQSKADILKKIHHLELEIKTAGKEELHEIQLEVKVLQEKIRNIELTY